MRYVALRARHVRGECPEDGKGRTGIDKVEPVCSSLWLSVRAVAFQGYIQHGGDMYKCPVSHGKDATMIHARAADATS